jgi:hypothetical protein
MEASNVGGNSEPTAALRLNDGPPLILPRRQRIGRPSGLATRLAMPCRRTYLEHAPASGRREPMRWRGRPKVVQAWPVTPVAGSIDSGSGACVERGTPRGGVAEWLKAAVC